MLINHFTFLKFTSIVLYRDLDDITLLDSFCGSGTTLVLAQELKMKSIGMDINPYAVLLSKVKTKNIKKLNAFLS